MLTKNNVLFLIMLFLIPAQSYALTRFPKGTCSLEGLLIKATNEPNWYFIVNSGTNSETRFRIKTLSASTEVSEKGQFIKATIDIPAETFSLYGVADFKKIDEFLNPYNEVKHYDLAANVQKACSLDRVSNSLSKPTKKKTHK